MVPTHDGRAEIGPTFVINVTSDLGAERMHGVWVAAGKPPKHDDGVLRVFGPIVAGVDSTFELECELHREVFTCNHKCSMSMLIIGYTSRLLTGAIHDGLNE